MIKVSLAVKTDVNQISDIEAKLFSTPWTIDALENTMRNNLSDIIVAKDNNRVAGYLIYCFSKYDINILRIAVDGLYQHRGIGTQMHDYLMSQVDIKGLDGVFLEVRESNNVAKLFYNKLGYKFLSIRKNFYKKPIEDAIVMTLKSE